MDLLKNLCLKNNYITRQWVQSQNECDCNAELDDGAKLAAKIVMDNFDEYIDIT